MSNVNDIIKKLKEENKVLPATTDAVFKNVMQDKSMKGVLSYLISEIVGLNYNYVYNNLVFRNSELLNEKALEKRKIADLIVDIEDMTINLEMNTSDNLELKNSYYHHSLMASALKRGEKHKLTKQVIQINFDKVNKYDDRIILKFTMKDEEGKYEIDKNYVNYHINLDKIYKKYYNKENLNRFEKILLIMMLEDKDELKKVSRGDKELENMVNKIFYESEDPDAIGVYDKEAMNEWLMEVAEERGHIKGEAKGKTEGKNERNLEIANNMLLKKMKINDIAEITGLSKEEIESLK